MVQIRNSGLILSISAKEIEHLRTQFERQTCILLPTILAPDLLQVIQQKIAEAEFFEKAHGHSVRLSVELCMKNNAASAALHLLANNPKFFHFVQQVTGCDQIGCFMGRVYRLIPESYHYDSWHDDVKDNRILAMSINLSTDKYDGGILQIRDRRSNQITYEIANIGFGDCIIFTLAPHLQHRVTSVTGTVAKTAFAGWFKSVPSYQAILMESLLHLRSDANQRESEKASDKYGHSSASLI